ncbi:MAG: hypothetical protein PHY28_07220 [Dehalococcoidales bacterium]|nr:hypothetical protein [Dehalococcoidales bacterium]
MINSNEKPIWQFVALDQFSVPMQQTSKYLHNRRKTLWQWLHRTAIDNRSDKPEAYDSSSSRYLAEIIPEWGWAEAVPAMETALEPWLMLDTPPSLVQAIVGAPHSRTSDILRHCAGKRGWHIVEAPEPHEILTGGESWLQKLPENNVAPLVIPNLERCYLRHPDGLMLLRRFIEWLRVTRPRCVIGCNSWSWAYLSKVAQLTSICPSPLTLAPFDKVRLEQWLRKPAMETGINEIPSDFLEYLALSSRGNAGVAWAIWYYSFVSCAKAGIEVPAYKSTDNLSKESAVAVFTRLKLPLLPPEVGKADAFVLHTIVLHGCLLFRLFPEILGLPVDDLAGCVHRLSAAHLIEVKEEALQVTVLGYPAVREFLSEEGFFLDVL